MTAEHKNRLKEFICQTMDQMYQNATPEEMMQVLKTLAPLILPEPVRIELNDME